jgi:hypothetical protein
MLASVGIAAVEIAARQDAFALGQVHPTLHTTYHLFCRSGYILILPGCWPAIGPQQQVNNYGNSQQKK